jgi:tetratricopeptide (TPR) repeat protein
LREAGTGQLTGPERVQHLLDVALVNNFLGQIQLGQGALERAARHFTDGLRAARRAPDRFIILISLYDLALSRQVQGDLAEATRLLKQGLSLAAEAGDEPSAAYYLEALATVAEQQDNPGRAVCLLAAAGALLQARAAAGCTATYRAPRTTLACWPRCARVPETRHSSRRGREAAPSRAPAPCSTRWSKRPHQIPADARTTRPLPRGTRSGRQDSAAG